MLPAAVYQGRHGPFGDIFNAAANERKTLSGKISNLGREIELAVEPRLYGVLVRRCHVKQMSPDQGSQVGSGTRDSRRVRFHARETASRIDAAIASQRHERS
jgi:hypothetical protein